MVDLKTRSQIATMREAGRIVARTLAAVADAAKPGVRLIDLDRMAASLIESAGAKPSFLGYHPRWAPVPYPGVLCLSVNEVIVHGIPNGRVLREGDLLSIDCGAYVDGLHADAALSVAIGTLDDAGQKLIDVTRDALQAAVSKAVVGGHLGDLSHAVESVGRAHRYGIPYGLGGHGIGRAMHEDPSVSNTGAAGRGLLLREGLTLAIEPQFTEGGRDDHRTGADGWTVETRDGSRAAHFEHTIAITAEGPQILTVL